MHSCFDSAAVDQSPLWRITVSLCPNVKHTEHHFECNERIANCVSSLCGSSCKSQISISRRTVQGISRGHNAQKRTLTDSFLPFLLFLFIFIYLFIYLGLGVEINICLIPFPSSLGSLHFFAVPLGSLFVCLFFPHSNSLN